MSKAFNRMQYFFIEYTENDVIPGDWEWYIDSYIIDPHSGARLWEIDNKLVAQAYAVPSALDERVVTAMAFVPMNAKKFSGVSLPARDPVRWGVLTCIRRDLAELLGSSLTEHAMVGQIQLRNGEIVNKWRPVVIKNRISIAIGHSDGASATAKHLDGKPIYASDRFSLIVRRDIYDIIRGFRFDGCKISTAAY